MSQPQRPRFPVASLLLLAGCSAPDHTTAPNATDGVALDGYDLVSYREEGGPQRGSPDLAYEYQGLVYLFVDAENRAQFAAAPERYLPAYGGWCAYAVSEGYTHGVNPECFLVEDDRLLMFYDGPLGDTRQAWLEEREGKRRAQADGHWQEWEQAEAEGQQ
jgi:hypothetical protein